MSENGFTQIVYFWAGQIANFSNVPEASVKMSKYGLEMFKITHAAKGRTPVPDLANLRIISTGRHKPSRYSRCGPNSLHLQGSRGQFSFSACHTDFLWELSILQLCTRMFPCFQALRSTFGGLGKDQRSRGNKWFPMHIEFPLILTFPLSLKFNIGKIPVHHLNQ